MAVDDYNRRAVAALERAQALSGVRSANGFARLLAQRASGSPSASTYRRWIMGEAVVPAWAIEVAAEVAGTTVQSLLGDERPELEDWRAHIEESIGRLEGEIIELREQLDLPRQGHELKSRDRSPSHERIAT